MSTQKEKTDEASKKWLIVALVVTAVVMGKVVMNGWVNWDDDLFVNGNPLVENRSMESFQEIFSSFQIGVYSPLVLLSYWVDYTLGGFNAGVFHTINLLIHLANVALVFTLVKKLFGRIEIATITAILFGIHPLSVEVVAWVTARKDLLLTLFYLLALLRYVKSLEDKENANKHKRWTFVFFLLALLSKGVAVTFPVVLLLVDYLKGRSISWALLREKVPFFLMSVVFGIVAIYAQQDASAIKQVSDVPFSENVFIGFYGLTMYLMKALFPLHLSTFHPYPHESDGALPTAIYLAILIVVPIIFLLRRGLLKQQRALVFGLLFFLVNVALVLQFLPVGSAAYSERYFYLSGIGLVLLIAVGIVWLADRWKTNALFVIAPILLFFAVQTFARIDVWKDSMALWNDVIEKYPDDNFGYFARADTYRKQGDEERAIKDYSKGMEFGVDYEALNNRALLYMNRGEMALANADLDHSLKLNPDYVNAIGNKGLLLLNAGQLDEALKLFDHAIALESETSVFYFNRGLAYAGLGKDQEAISDFTRAIQLEENAKFYLERGRVRYFSGDPVGAFKDFEKSLQLDPNDPATQFLLGEMSFQQGNLDAALKYYDQAIKLGFRGEQALVNKGLVLLNMGRYQEAVNVLNIPINDPNVQNVPAYFNRGIAYQFLGNHEAAIADFKTCLQLDPKFGQAQEWMQKSLDAMR